MNQEKFYFFYDELKYCEVLRQRSFAVLWDSYRRLITLAQDQICQRRIWLPELDARWISQPQEVYLLVKLTARRFKH